MFKLIFVVACAFVFSVNALPKPIEPEEKVFIPIISSNFQKEDDGAYNVNYESGDGTTRQEQSKLVDAGTDDQAFEVSGSYKYLNEEGQEVEVFYTAGKNGFVPRGSVINPEITAVAEAAKDLPAEVPEEKPERFST